MINHLYDVFKKWSYTDEEHKNSIYFYSDPHFGDVEIQNVRKKNGTFISDDEQVKIINSIVHKNDTIVFLGDIGDVEYIKKLKAGYKILIIGNHDKGASNYKRIIEWVPSEIPGHYIIRDNKLFDEVYEGPLTISDKILLSHEPVKYEFALNIHGHNHSGWPGVTDKHLNVCAEIINYIPITLKSIVESGELKDLPNIHRETIDKAVLKKHIV